ncbi:MAG: tellurium resistance protein [Actinomycetota bacterium]|nr:tellurium resistance protein [Actinomycetota bacterium]
MAESPGGSLATRPLHFFWLADCSGSMAAGGKIQALNNAIRETIPHLRDVAAENPYAEMLVRCAAFSTGARWHMRTTPVDALEWMELKSEGFTDLGAALDLVAAELRVPPMPERALPPAMVLISDGQPTDDFESALEDLLALPWGMRAVRLAVAIGHDADLGVLEQFIARDDVRPLTANNPEQLVGMIRWASTVASRLASEPMSHASEELAVPIPEARIRDDADVIW